MLAFDASNGIRNDIPVRSMTEMQAIYQSDIRRAQRKYVLVQLYTKVVHENKNEIPRTLMATLLRR